VNWLSFHYLVVASFHFKLDMRSNVVQFHCIYISLSPVGTIESPWQLILYCSSTPQGFSLTVWLDPHTITTELQKAITVTHNAIFCSRNSQTLSLLATARAPGLIPQPIYRIKVLIVLKTDNLCSNHCSSLDVIYTGSPRVILS